MDQVWPIVTGVLIANLLTALFLYGAVRASRTYHDSDVSAGMIACIVVPLFVAAAGVYLSDQPEPRVQAGATPGGWKNPDGSVTAYRKGDGSKPLAPSLPPGWKIERLD